MSGDLFHFDPSIFPWWSWWVWARDVVGPWVTRIDLWQVILLGGVLGVGGGMVVRAGRSLHRRPSTAKGSSRFATTQELRPLMTPGGTILGRVGRVRPHVLYAPRRTHTLIISPTQGGKSSLLATALVRGDEDGGETQERHAIVGDPKGGELYRMTAGWRGRGGRPVYVVAPLRAETHRINVLKDCVRLDTLDEWGDMFRISQRMLAASTQQEVLESESSRYFRVQGTTLHAAVGLFILKVGKRKSFAGMLHAMSFKEKLLEAMMTHEHPNISQIAEAVFNMADREQSAVWGTAMSVLNIYYNPRVAWATDETTCEWRGMAPSTTPTSLYLVTDRVTDLQELFPLYRAILGRVVDDFTTPGPRPLEADVLIDEFPHWGRMDVFETGVTQLAGFKVNCTLAAQDLGQLWSVYGHQTAIWGNTTCKVFHTPAPGDETAQRLSEMLSQETIRVESTTTGTRQVSVTAHEAGRSLMTADEIARMPSRRGLLFVRGQWPAYIWQATYHDNPTLQRRITL